MIVSVVSVSLSILESLKHCGWIQFFLQKKKDNLMPWQIQEGIKKSVSEFHYRDQKYLGFPSSKSECLNIIFDNILLTEIQKIGW